jgi:hypothetical protein
MSHRVEVKKAKIATGQVGGKFTLLHVPSDRFVVLYDEGQRIWEKLERGVTDIHQLVGEHAQEHNVPVETAAFEVISFLDELRAQGFIDFALEREREAAPLLDAQTSLADARAEHVLRLISGKRPFDTHPLARVAPLDPPDTMTLDEILRHADAASAAGAAPVAQAGPGSASSASMASGTSPASSASMASGGAAGAAPVAQAGPPNRNWFVIPRPTAGLALEDIERLVGAGKGVPAFQHRRVVHLHGPAPDLTVRELETVANLGLDAVPVERRGGVDLLDDVRPDITVGDLEGTTPQRARIVVVVVIVTGPIIVVIVIDGGPGPTAGKSRQACKTMCV